MASNRRDKPQQNGLKRARRVIEGKIEWGKIARWWMGLIREKGMGGS